MTDRTLASALERLAAIGASAMDGAPPVREDGTCAMCLMQVDDPPLGRDSPIVDHDPLECGWWIARNQLSQSDINEVRRLAHVLRYDGNSPDADARR